MQDKLAEIKDKINRLPADRQGKWLLSYTCTERALLAARERGDVRGEDRIAGMLRMMDKHVTTLLEDPHVVLPDWKELG